MGGVAVRPDVALEALRPSASGLLMLPGGPGWDDAGAHGPALAAAQRFLDAGVPVAAICGATAGLARSGQLDARPHTSNALSYLKGTGYAGAESYVDEPAVSDGVLITAGGTAGIRARDLRRTRDLRRGGARGVVSPPQDREVGALRAPRTRRRGGHLTRRGHRGRLS